jgi:hypothetical protein
MAVINLTWTPAGGLNSTGQQVQYKQRSASDWETAVVLGATESSYVLEGLEDNVVYEIRIVNECLYGGPAPSVAKQTIYITCPVVALVPSYNAVGFSFTHLGGDISQYWMELLDGLGAAVLDAKYVFPSVGVVTDSFTGLDPVTDYQLRVTPQRDEWVKECLSVAFSTEAPVCDPPTNLLFMFN